MTRYARALSFAILVGHAPGAGADDSFVGTYRGNLTIVTQHGQVPFGIDLEILAADNGTVRATMTEYGHRPESMALCNATSAMRGTFEGNSLKLRTIKRDENTCMRHFELVKEGDALVGTTGKGQRVELHRR